MSYSLTKVLDKIYLLKFEDHYDLCMTFLRYSEFYESGNPDFRGKQFQILDYMEWFARTYGNGVFNYPEQWAGFNIPSTVIEQVDNLGIADFNRYDERMLDIHCHLKTEAGGDYYLIGVSDDETIDHEVAHGLYSTNLSYRSEMERLIDSLPKRTYRKICDYLTSVDYAESSHRDEIQAYIATGGFSKKAKITISQKASKKFSSTFNRYLKNNAEAEKTQSEQAQEG
jgi:hypothetical protein